MNPEYASYCTTDRHFYDAPHRSSDAAEETGALYGPACGPVPEGWERSRRGDWMSFSPRSARVPSQGWKIHVSAGLDNAPAVLGKVADYCLGRGLPFKFIPGPRLLHLRNAKYADRAGSGKFITVYPLADDDFPEVCTGLMRLLEGEHGPGILSDLRCGTGPVHVRYGAFAPRFCAMPDGRLVPAIADPEGRLVPDPRGPSLVVPEWVSTPSFLLPHLEARAAVSLDGVPYSVERALHFSNGGGVYLGRDDRSGEPVVLKEARPHAGLAADGADATVRLERERTALERLAGLDCVPAVRDVLDIGGHRFLVLEHITGDTLNTVFARRFPLVGTDPAPGALAEHAAWATRMYTMVERAVRDVHGRGLVVSDLHMSNIMVADDGTRVVLLDFEAAAPARERGRQIVANPAFVAPSDRRGTDIDDYALACLRIALLLPLTTLFFIDRRKAAPLAAHAERVFGLAPGTLDGAVGEILRGLPEALPERTAPVGRTNAVTRVPGTPDRGPDPVPPAAADWPLSRDAMARAIFASRTPERDDRCFPGDIAQFATPAGGQSLGNGAAGVLYALHETGAASCPDALDWLEERSCDPAPGTPPGLYDGLTGIAWTLARLGRAEPATRLALLAARQPFGGLSAGLHSGLAGIALALADLARTASAADAAVLSRAADHCTALAVRTLTENRPLPGTGLLHGATGIALLLIRRYEATGDAALLDLAAVALHRDLARCRPGADDALLVVEGRRTMPYLGAGSAGIALVIDDYLAHRPDEALDTARHALLRACRSAFYIQPGLFRGTAGLILHLARTGAGDPAELHGVIRRHTGLLDLHALPYGGGLAFAGEQLMRLSMDLSTGTAGCLLALGSAFAGHPVALPFLPLRRPTPPHRAAHGPVSSGTVHK
ncbi:class III lanthionine synthetase LanKC [Streptomyces sp. MH13]|uniref:class III lanthionine synthetase LanKC n=1 Tax=Streptomyces sp. MH13 TaxID=3417651 RepID=UPI003CEE3B8E